MKIVQISDTHISQHGGTTNDNFALIAEFINEQLRPDAIVHSGDVTIMDPDADGDRVVARQLLDTLDAPLYVLPGNHDIGDSAQPWVVTSDRVRAFTNVFGDDHWVRPLGDIALVGINSEIMGVGLPEEEAQWEWLETLPELVGDRRALVFCHKPLWAPSSDAQSHPMSVPEQSTPRLLDILASLDVAAYASGHLHRYLLEQRAGASVVSAPATAFTAGSAADFPGLRQLGVVEYDITDGVVTPRFRTVPTIVERDLMDTPEAVRALVDAGLIVSA
jgi:3',5'-cyclic AMP phosphodiesterase CpdA